MNIFWIKKNELAGSNLPVSLEDIHMIHSAGIRFIVSTTFVDNIAGLIKTASKFEINHLKLNIKDFSTPNNDQITAFIAFANKARIEIKPLLVHCYAGCGRTGLLLVIYLVIFENNTIENALRKVREIRPCAVESYEQENFLQKLEINYFRSFIYKT